MLNIFLQRYQAENGRECPSVLSAGQLCHKIGNKTESLKNSCPYDPSNSQFFLGVLRNRKNKELELFSGNFVVLLREGSKKNMHF